MQSLPVQGWRPEWIAACRVFFQRDYNRHRFMQHKSKRLYATIGRQGMGKEGLSVTVSIGPGTPVGSRACHPVPVLASMGVRKEGS
jgi:hypothetical protein